MDKIHHFDGDNADEVAWAQQVIIMEVMGANLVGKHERRIFWSHNPTLEQPPVEGVFVSPLLSFKLLSLHKDNFVFSFCIFVLNHPGIFG